MVKDLITSISLVFLCVEIENGFAQNWEIQVVDSSGVYSDETSITVDINNHPYISYSRDFQGSIALSYARWTGSAWIIEYIDTLDASGYLSSLALDNVNNPHISYDAVSGGLKYAQWTGSDWLIEVVDPGADAHSSIAIDNNGNPHILSVYVYPCMLNHYRRVGNIWITEEVDSSDNPEGGELAINSTNNPCISYIASRYDLCYAYWDGANWIIEVIDTNFCSKVSLALDNNDFPHISYCGTEGNLFYAYWTGADWVIEAVDTSVDVVRCSSVVIDNNGYPHIGYMDYPNNTLKYAKWTGTNWSIEVVDISCAGGVSLALGTNNSLHMSYRDQAGDLKYAFNPGGGVNERKSRSMPNNLFNCSNPSRRRAIISYYLCEDTRVSLKVYDITGRVVCTLVDGNQTRGFHRVTWDCKDSNGQEIASGVYLCKLTALGQNHKAIERVTKMIVLK